MAPAGRILRYTTRPRLPWPKHASQGAPLTCRRAAHARAIHRMGQHARRRRVGHDERDRRGLQVEEQAACGSPIAQSTGLSWLVVSMHDMRSSSESLMFGLRSSRRSSSAAACTRSPVSLQRPKSQRRGLFSADTTLSGLNHGRDHTLWKAVAAGHPQRARWASTPVHLSWADIPGLIDARIPPDEATRRLFTEKGRNGGLGFVRVQHRIPRASPC